MDIKTDIPDLAIVDVQMMSQNEIRLRNHPLIIEERLPIAFYYSDETIPLLNSTFGILNYGNIKEENEHKGQVEQILRRREEFVQLREEKEILEERIKRLRKRNATIISEIFDIKNVTTQQQLALKVAQEVEKNLDSSSFVEALANTFENWSDILKFSVYELNQSKDRLVSPSKISKKYLGLPSLYLGQNSHKGIETFAIDMANQVARDLMGKGLKVIQIKGDNNHVRMLIIMEVNLDRFVGFSWPLFEMNLSGLYARTQIAVQETQNLKDEISSWDFFSLLDQMLKEKKNDSYKIVHISFSQLNEIVKQRPDNRFYWRSFYKELDFELNKILADKGIFSFFGTKSLLAIIPQDKAEMTYNMLKHLIEKFPYYRFFEDSALVVSKELKPRIRVISPGAANALRHIEGQYNELEASIEIASQRAASIMSRTEV